MKKKHIYNEFNRIAAEIVGDCRKAQRYYVMQMCEQLGKIDYKKPFVMWCNKKRVIVYQSGMTEPKPHTTIKSNGSYYLFRNNTEHCDKVDLNLLNLS